MAVVAFEQMASTNEALGYYEDGMSELGRALHGEEHAKQAILIGAVILRPFILSGIPAGGKSTLMQNAWRLYGGVDYEDVARIPGQHDLTATQLVGGEIATYNGRREKSLVVVEGLVKPSTRAIVVEEMNRTNPEAVNSLLPVLEDRRLETTAGHVAIPNLVYVGVAMNPSESRQSTFPVSDAMASRLTLGAVLGVKGQRDERLANVRAIREHKKKPENGAENIRPIYDAAHLPGLRNYVMATRLSETMSAKIDEVTINTSDALESHGIHETDNRLPLHIEMNAMALGSFRTEEHIVRDEDIVDAVYLVLAGRFGAKKQTNGLNLDALAREITQF
ncbi:MAG TPA: AAA family ATPase [Verrucomicrobiae bacterium]|nr:AAA family ATPase [Verrucomicrobiae bacterium]